MYLTNKLKNYSKYFQLCLSILSLGILTGCDMIEFHPYDLDIDGETVINAKNINRIESALQGKDAFAF